MHGGKQPEFWPDEAVPLSHILNQAFEWTIHAKLSPEQVRTNDRFLAILEQVAKLERGAFFSAQTITEAQEIASSPFPNPTQQTLKGELRPNMNIRDLLRQLPISKWPPARPAQCFHPECKKSRQQMQKHDHLQSHKRQRNYVTDPLKTLPGAFHVDGESCLTATTASLLNVFAITQKKSTLSNAYKIGASKEKHLNTFADLDNSLKHNAWHDYVGDFWGPILENLRTGGGWLTLEEIFDTGFQHRFVPKDPAERESWERQVDVHNHSDDDPAITLYKEIGRTYRDGLPAFPIPMEQLFDIRCCLSLEHPDPDRRSHREDIDEDHNLRPDHQLSLEEPPDSLIPVEEVGNWDLEVQNRWTDFKAILEKSGLQQRVEIEAYVRNRRALWIAMDAEK
jgi:hypothetical protein